ncbi:hypothetical protein [Halorubrum sp. AJ67]|uniref:hypothetical protein n=1 Tax=Halorubrum sp. AJ67 TaxID=1173487 RepID=UPI00064EC69B|nr:hypothetical protein [Halorubrum sp. AJ67]
MNISSLPNRKLSFNEKEQLAATALEAVTVSPTRVGDPKDAPTISDFVLITEDSIHGVHFNGDSWERLATRSKPDGAFEGAFITNTDHDHDEYREVVEALDDARADPEE